MFSVVCRGLPHVRETFTHMIPGRKGWGLPLKLCCRHAAKAIVCIVCFELTFHFLIVRLKSPYARGSDPCLANCKSSSTIKQKCN